MWPYLEKRSLQMWLKSVKDLEMKSSWIRAALEPKTGFRGRQKGKQRQGRCTGRRPYEDRGRLERCVHEPRNAKVANSHQRQGKRHGTVLLRASRRNQPCWHLDWGFPASVIMREQISVVLSCIICGTGFPCYPKVRFTPLCFYERPTLVPVFANPGKSAEDFCFYGKMQQAKIAFSICFAASCYRGCTVKHTAVFRAFHISQSSHCRGCTLTLDIHANRCRRCKCWWSTCPVGFRWWWHVNRWPSSSLSYILVSCTSHHPNLQWLM